MKMCQNHWDKLRHAIQSRGLNDFVSTSGEDAAKRFTEACRTGKLTLKNFDPLMGAHNKILENAMQACVNFGVNPIAMLAGNSEHSEHNCPICFLNYLSIEHDRTCMEPECQKPKGMTFDDWIDKAADGVAEFIKTLPAEAEAV